MKLISAIAGGVAGAVTITLIHEITRRLIDDAPRMDKMGMEALENTLEKAGAPVPEEKTLFKMTMAGDILSNSIYYAISGAGAANKSFARGGALGLAAGIGAVVLPKYIGLHPAPSNRTPQTKLMTTGLYLIGGIVAGAVTKYIDKNF